MILKVKNLRKEDIDFKNLLPDFEIEIEIHWMM